MMHRLGAWCACAATLVASAACGTNRPEIPDYLLAQDSGTVAAYPPGPYATSAEVGEVIENFVFADGWMNPEAAGYDPAKLAPIAFADFYDPDGGKNYEILLLNTAAFWCGACVLEHGGTNEAPSLNEHFDALRPRGFGLLSLLFQDAKAQPASVENLIAWTENFKTRFPMVRDPEYQMGRYASSTTAPLNLVIDARTMRVLQVYLGDQRAVIWPYIEAELAARGK